MDTKITKRLIHLWILLCSIFTLGVGWATLAHSDKPAALPIFSSSTPISDVVVQDVPALETLVSNTSQGASAQLAFNVSSMPRMRTAGS